MTEWISDLKALTADGNAAVLVSVVHTAGSTPREAGARMCVTADAMRGTVGGGRLEYEALRLARERLAAGDADGAVHVELFGLGPRLEQCCGGVVHLAFETISNSRWPAWLTAAEAAIDAGRRIAVVARIGAGAGAHRLIVNAEGASDSIGPGELDDTAAARAQALLNAASASDATMESLSPGRSTLPNPADALIYDVIVPESTHVVLLGAGHVARALAPVIASAIPCRLAWADARADQFPAALPPGTQRFDDPAAAVRDAPAGALYLVMTHSHDLDQQLTEAILRRGDARYVGLIGSRTKRARFLARFEEHGLTSDQIAALTCPIGLAGINGKKPGAIAVAVVAQLLQLLDDDAPGQIGGAPDLNAVESA